MENITFDETIIKVTEELKKEGFGVLSDIDVQATMKKKLNVDFIKYRILGACNPPFALKTLQAEINIGTMLPCNVVVMEKEKGEITVSAIDPIASLMAVGNTEIVSVANLVHEKLKKVIAKLYNNP
jgi:uncharacterized protein (DUF302 family)